MNSRTARAAQAVAAQLTPTQLEDYGNIVLNGYQYGTTAVATAGEVGSLDAVSITTAGTNYTNGTYRNVWLSSSTGSFGYADVVVAGGAVTGVTIVAEGRGFVVGETITMGNLPRTLNGDPAVLTVTQVNQYGVRPAMKGWTTNYAEYYTELPPNAYGTNPGDPTGFNYTVHSYTPLKGPIASIGGAGGIWVLGGEGYTPGVYTGIALSGGSGAGAVATFVVNDIFSLPRGPIASFIQTEPGEGYPGAVPPELPISVTGDGFGATFTGLGNLFPPYSMVISAITDGGFNYAVGDILEFPGGHRVTPVPPYSSFNAQVQVDLVGYYGVASLVSLTNPGTDYQVGDVLTAALPGGVGLSLPVGAIVQSGLTTGGDPRWSQLPSRGQGQYGSYIYPRADRIAPPPIGIL